MRRGSVLLWCAVQTLTVITGFLQFFRFAPWLSTAPISQASTEVRAALPAECPAFFVNHGQYFCAWHDTISRNPVGFWTDAILLFTCFGFLALSVDTGKGFGSAGFRSWRSKIGRKDGAGDG
jgi:hypothetical protein